MGAPVAGAMGEPDIGEPDIGEPGLGDPGLGDPGEAPTVVAVRRSDQRQRCERLECSPQLIERAPVGWFIPEPCR